MKYKIKKIISDPYRSDLLVSYKDFALELADQYGLLEHFSLEEIIEIYSQYSNDYYCAGWIAPSKEMIEDAFGVELEESF